MFGHYSVFVFFRFVVLDFVVLDFVVFDFVAFDLSSHHSGRWPSRLILSNIALKIEKKKFQLMTEKLIQKDFNLKLKEIICWKRLKSKRIQLITTIKC